MPMDGPVSNSSSNKENTITIFVLGALTSVYIYLLLSPSQPHLSSRPRNFAIDRDTKEAFNAFYERFKKVQYPTESYGSFDGLDANNTSADYSSEFAHDKHNDDFFMDYDTKSVNKKEDVESSLPNIPSSNFHCGEGWLSIRAEINFKYLWMHASEKGWMGATATLDTPIHRRSFQMVPVTENCEGGWVRLRAAHSDGFVLMVAPTGEFIVDEWVVKLGSDLLNITADDRNYHFLIEDGGYLLNRGSMAFVNVMPEAEYSVRGHTSGWDRTKASGRQYASNLRFYYLEESDVQDSIQLEKYDAMEASMEDKLQIDEIAKFPKSGEKRVISFGIYGSLEKYMVGAVRNAALAAIYFPGWVCRFYIAADVPVDTVIKLRGLGAEIEVIPKGMGYSSGMFWRFMVASDPTVDRYIIRDSDSRLNSRDRFAVEDWINSQYPVHILRDHINHCSVPINGGMWGGVKGAIPQMKEEIAKWSSRDEYSSDLKFLKSAIWPDIRDKQISHDSYCCDRFPNTKPYPTRRFKTYQHVGQVFDSHDMPRMIDIDSYIRGVPIPSNCRKDANWIYG